MRFYNPHARPGGPRPVPCSTLIRQVLGERCAAILGQLGVMNGDLNMTELALRLSRYANGVSLRHGQVSRSMFPEYNIDAITNGVHAVAWTSAPFCALYDRRDTRMAPDNRYLRYAIGIPLHEISQAHAQAKKELFQQVRWLTGIQLESPFSPSALPGAPRPTNGLICLSRRWNG